MSGKRDRLLAVVAIASLCVVGIGALKIALRSDKGKQGGGAGSEGGPARYVDSTSEFSLMVDPRFAGSTGPGLTVESGHYAKSWNAEDSPTSGVQPLDTFGVSVS